MIRKKKENFFEKCLPSPSVRAQNLCTLKLKKDNRVYAFVWKVYTGYRSCQNFDPNARRLKKPKPTEIFNDFAISQEPFDEIDSYVFYFKGIE